MRKELKVIGVIPAHLESLRFKRKVLHNILGLPMIEHVRRRVERAGILDEVFVASGDDEILDTVTKNGGNAFKTFKSHSNGTSRVAESIKSKDCTHVLIIQGDEPLVKKEHIKNMSNAIKKNPEIDSWNSISNIFFEKDLFEKNIVKAAINEQNKILYCFRRSPSFSENSKQFKYIKKIQGLIGFRKETLLKLEFLHPPKCEIYESIEQLRIISHGLNLFGVMQKDQVPSINEEKDLDDLFSYLENNKNEYKITQQVINGKY